MSPSLYLLLIAVQIQEIRTSLLSGHMQKY